jgi:hypothetical protein
VQLGENGLGTVTFTTAPTATQTITFLSSIPRTQSTDYINIGTDKFPADSHEGTVDKLTLISREQDEAVNRAILLPESSNLTGVNIPVSVANANKAIVVNSTGDNLDAKNLADIGTATVTDYAKTLLDDNNASEARTTLGVQQDVVTTEGDLIKGSSGGEAERLPVGSNKQILQSNGTNPVWSNDLTINNLTVHNKLNTRRNETTISSGAIAYTGAYMVVDTEGAAASDDLDTISGGSAGDVVIIRSANDVRNVVLKHSTAGANNLNLTNARDITLGVARDKVVLIRNSNGFWEEVTHSTDSDFANYKATNGYTYLPNGLIFQWGFKVDTGTNMIITLPLTFPNSFLNFSTQINHTAANYQSTTGQIIDYSSFRVYWDSGALGVYWTAIGY